MCSATKVLSSNRPILGFSAGDGYLLVVGDIVKQISSKKTVPQTLSCIEDLNSETNSLNFEQSAGRDTLNSYIAESHVVPSQDSR